MVCVAGARVPGRSAFGTACVAHALSQSVGFAVLTGTAVRVRAYGRRHVGATDVARVSAAVTVTLTLGLLSAAAWALFGTSIPIVVRGHSLGVRPLGLLLGVVVAAYLAWSVVGRGQPGSRNRWRIARPTPRVAVAQIALSTADWLVTGSVLYAFMTVPVGLGVWSFLPIYVIAQTIGVVSHVPAGAGVFEVALLSLVMTANPGADRATLLAAIIMYRAVYYVLPLCSAILVAGVSELGHSRAVRVAQVKSDGQPILQ